MVHHIHASYNVYDILDVHVIDAEFGSILQKHRPMIKINKFKTSFINYTQRFAITFHI